MLGFVCAALANSFLPLPQALPAFLARCGKFMIAAAMAAIGLSTDARALLSGGRRPIILGLACWIAISLVSLAAQGLTRTL